MVRHLAVNQTEEQITSQVGSIPTLSAKLGSRLIGRISDFESEDVGSNPTSPATFVNFVPSSSKGRTWSFELQN